MCRSALAAPMRYTVERRPWGMFADDVPDKRIGAAEWPALSVPWGPDEERP